MAALSTPTTSHVARTTALIVCGIALVDAALVFTRDFDPLRWAFEIFAICAVTALQLSYFSRPFVTVRRPLGQVLLAVQAALVIGAAQAFGHPPTGMTGFVAASALVVWPKAGRVVVAATVVFVALMQPSPAQMALSAVATTTVALLLYGLPRFAELVQNVRDTHRAERARVSRDLHDLLGYSLSAIKLKSELSHRLLLNDPDQARGQLEEILEVTGHALADVRAVARGYRPMSFEEASTSAQALLSAAGVDVRASVEHDSLPDDVETVLATVLREGVTNVLRHSKAEECHINVRQTPNVVVLDIINDGAHEDDTDPTSSGLQNLAERVDEVSGELTARRTDDGRFHLRSTIPLVRD
jgi:two-component system sensor histidine kinase DesK